MPFYFQEKFIQHRHSVLLVFILFWTIRKRRVKCQGKFVFQPPASVLIGIHCAILYHLYNLKNVKNIHGGVLLLVKLQVPLWVFFTFFKLCKWYKIAQRIANVITFVICPYFHSIVNHSYVKLYPTLHYC